MVTRTPRSAEQARVFAACVPGDAAAKTARFRRAPGSTAAVREARRSAHKHSSLSLRMLLLSKKYGGLQSALAALCLSPWDAVSRRGADVGLATAAVARTAGSGLASPLPFFAAALGSTFVAATAGLGSDFAVLGP